MAMHSFKRAGIVLAGLAAGLAAAVPMLAQTPAFPTQQADPAAHRGLAYAREACSGCHSVEPGVPAMPGAKARSFTAIASTPGMTSMALNVWFNTSHPTMPNLVISQRSKEDLYAYFDALRTAAKTTKAMD